MGTIDELQEKLKNLNRQTNEIQRSKAITKRALEAEYRKRRDGDFKREQELLTVALERYVADMAELPEGHEYHAPAEVVAFAKELLARRTRAKTEAGPPILPGADND